MSCCENFCHPTPFEKSYASGSISRDRKKNFASKYDSFIQSNRTSIMHNFSLGSDIDSTSVSMVTSLEDDNLMVASTSTRSLPNFPFSETTTTTANKLPTKKSVRFSNVTVREYRVCLGDNPSVWRGAPISLDWKYSEKEFCYSIEDFEKSEHSSLSYPTGSVSYFKRSSLDRLLLLKDLGYSRGEIKEATEIAYRVRKQRFQTRRRVEFTDKIKVIFSGILFESCRSSRDGTHDIDNLLSDTLSTLSTRNSIDSLALGTDVAIEWPKNRLQRLRSKSDGINTERRWTGRNIGRKMRHTREAWQERILEQRKKWQTRWQREPCESLDMARHRSVVIDLSGP